MGKYDEGAKLLKSGYGALSKLVERFNKLKSGGARELTESDLPKPEGRPIKMGFGGKTYYHSTDAKRNFKKFSDNELETGFMSSDSIQQPNLGFHFGSLKAAHDRMGTKSLNVSGSRVIPVKINIKNPIRLKETEGENWSPRGIIYKLDDAIAEGKIKSMSKKDITDWFNEEYEFNGVAKWDSENYQSGLHQSYDSAQSAWVKDFLESHGFDGIEYVNQVEDPGSISKIAFRPEQVRVPWAKFNLKNASSGDLLAAVAPVATAGALSQIKGRPE